MPHLLHYLNSQCRTAALPQCRALGLSKKYFWEKMLIYLLISFFFIIFARNYKVLLTINKL